MTSEFQQLKELIEASEGRLREEIRTIEKKVDRSQEFQAGLQGAAKIGLWILTAVGIIVGIYVGLHGIHSSTPTVNP